jgi:predicted MFS family arabinose efflux permease
MATLFLVLVGSVLAATAYDFGQLIAGRALQGFAYGVIPMVTATARAHLPRERLRTTIAALSVTTVTGAGLSFPLTGLIVQVSDYHIAFWAAVLLIAAALVAVLMTVPATPALAGSRSRNGLDWLGATLLAGALSCLLVAVSEGGPWGWSSGRVLGLVGAAAGLAAVWTWHELRTDRPLVDLRGLRNPLVWLANLAALCIGAVWFAGSPAVSQLLQTPVAAGYGFGLSLLAAGLALLPTSLGSQVASRLVTLLRRRFAVRLLLPVGPLLIGVNMAALAVWHDHLRFVLVALALLGLAIGAAYVVMPAMVLAAVPPDQTGSAVALNQVLRIVGGSVGSAATGAALIAATPEGAILPAESGYTAVFAGSAVGSLLLAAFLVLALLRTGSGGRRAER